MAASAASIGPFASAVSPGVERRPGRADLVAGGQHRHPRRGGARRAPHGRRRRRRRSRTGRWPRRPAAPPTRRRCPRRPGRTWSPVPTPAGDLEACRRRLRDLDRHDRVEAAGTGSPVSIGANAPAGKRPAPHLGRSHGEPVHGRAARVRHVVPRLQVDHQHPAERVVERHLLRLERRRRSRPRPALRARVERLGRRGVCPAPSRRGADEHALRVRVDVQALVAQEPDQRHAEARRGLDREAGGRRDRAQDGHAGGRRLLHQLEAGAARTPARWSDSGTFPSSSRLPISLSSALWRPTSSRRSSSCPSRSNSPAACSPPVRSNTRCAVAQDVGQRAEQRRARHREALGDRRAGDLDLRRSRPCRRRRSSTWRRSCAAGRRRRTARRRLTVTTLYCCSGARRRRST